MEKALFAGAFFLAYTLQAITGFAGNIFAMPVGTHLMGLSSSVAVLNIMGFFACGLLAVLNLKSIQWRELGKIVGVMTPFVLLGIWLDTLLPLEVLLKIFGVVVIAIGVRNLVRKKQKFMREWMLWVVLAGAGLIQGMFVSGGALLVIYAVQKISDKEKFRATLSMVWAILNGLYAAVAYFQGSFTHDVIVTVGICIPLAVLATVIGSALQKKISQEKFLKLTYVMLVAIGVVLLF